MPKHIDYPALQTDLADNPIDALLAGVPLEMLPAQFNLTQQEWQAIEMADQLADTNLATHSQLRGALKLYMTQEIAAQQEAYEAQSRRKKKGKRRRVSPWMIIVGVVIILLVGAATAFIVVSNSSGYTDDNYETYGAVPYVEGERNFYAGESRYGYPVYTPDNVVYGDLFTLGQMIVKPNDSGSMTDGIILVFELAHPVRSGRYSIVLEEIDIESLITINTESFRLVMPADQRLAFAVEYTLHYSHSNPSYFYRLEIVDTETEEWLMLPSGADFFELHPVPASIEPASGGSQATLPTIAPPATPIPR